MSCVWTPVEVIRHVCGNLQRLYVVCGCLERSEEGARSLELGLGADPFSSPTDSIFNVSQFIRMWIYTGFKNNGLNWCLQLQSFPQKIYSFLLLPHIYTSHLSQGSCYSNNFKTQSSMYLKLSLNYFVHISAESKHGRKRWGSLCPRTPLKLRVNVHTLC